MGNLNFQKESIKARREGRQKDKELNLFNNWVNDGGRKSPNTGRSSASLHLILVLYLDGRIQVCETIYLDLLGSQRMNITILRLRHVQAGGIPDLFRSWQYGSPYNAEVYINGLISDPEPPGHFLVQSSFSPAALHNLAEQSCSGKKRNAHSILWLAIS
jgi:hypothetical protein